MRLRSILKWCLLGSPVNWATFPSESLIIWKRKICFSPAFFLALSSAMSFLKKYSSASRTAVDVEGGTGSCTEPAEWPDGPGCGEGTLVVSFSGGVHSWPGHELDLLEERIETYNIADLFIYYYYLQYTLYGLNPIENKRLKLHNDKINI